MDRVISLLIAAVFYIAVGSFFNIDGGILLSLIVVFMGVILLTWISAYFYSQNNVMKDYPLSGPIVQYTFVSISAVYIGDAIRDSFDRSAELSIPPLLAGIGIAVFCVASVVESQIPAASQADKPEVGREATRKRFKGVLLGVLITVVAPILIGILVKPYM